jgi:hypothetical protein
MVYFIAVFLGFVACVQGFLSEITSGNITHLKNGRPPNARAALFPSIPFVPLVFVGVAWILRMVILEYATWILLGAFFTLSLFWAVSFARLVAELRRIEATANNTNDHAA